MKTDQLLMTEGSIYKKIVRFAVPIFFGNLFQQMYNVVDSLVIGNFAGKEALAAISSTTSLIFLLIGFFGGVFTGAGVVISRYFGARDHDAVQKSVHTAVALGIISGAIITILGTIFAPTILRLMGTPADIFDQSVLYVRIYFGGIITVVLYNTASGIFQATGNSKHPLYYLITSSIINVLLDLLFVIKFNWGVAGAAIATVIAQGVSVTLAFYNLTHSDGIYRVHLNKIRIDKTLLKEILSYGLPSGVQNSVIAIANVIVQSNINSFGASAVAGCGSHAKIQGFAFIPITSFAMAMTTFIGQNLGAKQYDRAKKGTHFGIAASIILAESVGILFYIFAPYLISIFNSDPEVVSFGATQARVESPFFFALAFSHCIAGILRGAGKSKVPMMVMLLCWCVIRVTYISIATYFIKDIYVIFWAYPITWSLSSILFLIYYLKSDWLHGFDKKDK